MTALSGERMAIAEPRRAPRQPLHHWFADLRSEVRPCDFSARSILSNDIGRRF
jgi:hypothetical protein